MILTQKTTKILGIVATVLTVVIGVMLVILPAFDKFQVKTEEMLSAEGEVEVMQSNRDGYLRSEALYPEIKEIYNDLNGRFPELSEHSMLLTALSESAINAGMPASAITGISFSAPAIFAAPIAPPAEQAPAEGEEAEAEETDAPVEETPVETQVAGGEYATMEVSFAIEGEPRQVQAFLDNLNKMTRAIISSGFSADMSMDPNTGARTAKAALTGQVFVYKKIASPEIPQDEVVEEEEEVMPGE